MVGKEGEDGGAVGCEDELSVEGADRLQCIVELPRTLGRFDSEQ